MPATHRLHALTGGTGSGKSTLLAALGAAGVATSEEVGRQILREQMALGTDALPWADERAFAALMLPRELAAHAEALARGTDVVLDRGVPDVIGFLRASSLPVPPAFDAAARAHRYNERVFFAPFWPEIMVTDAERPRGAAYAEHAGAVLRDTWIGYGYTLLELPRASVARRVAFVKEHLA